MKLVVQRVSSASVAIENQITGSIQKGLVVFLCIEKADNETLASHYARKVSGLRIFADDAGKMNLSVKEVGGSVLLISQFTLAGDAEKGMRPSFTGAAAPEDADRLYLHFAKLLRDEGVDVQTGIFRAMMKVALVNDGPVTIILGAKQFS